VSTTKVEGSSILRSLPEAQQRKLTPVSPFLYPSLEVGFWVRPLSARDFFPTAALPCPLLQALDLEEEDFNFFASTFTSAAFKVSRS
jgi:hypothetical protein